MAGKQDPTLVVLREIQQELQGTNARLDQANARLDQTNARLETLDNRVDFLGRRQTEAEMRLATEVIGVAKALGQVKDLLIERLDEHGRLEDHERRISVLEMKAG